MKLKNFICDMTEQGFTDEEIQSFLEDGETLKNKGFIDQNEIENEHEKIALKAIVNCKSEDDLLMTWELRNEQAILLESQLLRRYMAMIKHSTMLYGGDWWVFAEDDWHGFQELREAIEFVLECLFDDDEKTETEISLQELVNSLSDDELYKSWELKDNTRLNKYFDLVEDSHVLVGDQISRGLYKNLCFASGEYWVFLHDDWHGFGELREAIEFVIDFEDYNLEERT